LLAIGLVVLVIFLFLRNLRRQSFPRLLYPHRLLAPSRRVTFCIFKSRQSFLDGADAFGRFVVDDAVVMLKTFQADANRRGVMQAALHGSREIGFTIVR